MWDEGEWRVGARREVRTHSVSGDSELGALRLEDQVAGQRQDQSCSGMHKGVGRSWNSTGSVWRGDLCIAARQQDAKGLVEVGQLLGAVTQVRAGHFLETERRGSVRRQQAASEGHAVTSPGALIFNRCASPVQQVANLLHQVASIEFPFGGKNR